MIKILYRPPIVMMTESVGKLMSLLLAKLKRKIIVNNMDVRKRLVL